MICDEADMIRWFFTGAVIVSIIWGLAVLRRKWEVRPTRAKTCEKCGRAYVIHLSRSSMPELFCSEVCESSALMEMNK